MAALLTSLVLSFVFGSWFIEHSKRLFRSNAREWTPANHKAKDGLPTMGGIFIIIVVLISSLLWTDLSQGTLWIFFATFIGFGMLGLIDDLAKIRCNQGISALAKIVAQGLIALSAALFLYYGKMIDPCISFPFVKSVYPCIGIAFIFWIAFIIVATSNAVNLTDGLDGLALGSLIPNFLLYAIIAFLAGNYFIADYLHIPFAGSAEFTIVATSLMGACLGFLWYNTYPAQIFMGDVGSLALGSALAFIALISKQELLLPLAGGLFVMEALSVIIQVSSFKLTGNRIFKMAPIHHHFELHGWQESKITVRFAIISIILCLLALMTIKIR